MSIEQTLRLRLERAVTSVPVVELDVEETLAKGRRARRVAFVRSMGAAALVIGLGIAGAINLVNGETPRPVPPSGESPRPSVTQGPTQAEMESVVRSWLQAVEAGDEEGAWALMSEDARAAIGRDRFDQMMASELPGGFGALAYSGLDIEIIEVQLPGPNPGFVASMSGNLEQEGTTNFAAQAVPVRIEAGKPRVDETFVEPELLTAWTSASVGPRPFRAGDELHIEAIPSDIERVYLSIDGASPLRARFEGEAHGVVTLDRVLDAGLHAATIVLADEAGRTLTVARTFEAAAP